jgi:hypothetical protein
MLSLKYRRPSEKEPEKHQSHSGESKYRPDSNRSSSILSFITALLYRTRLTTEEPSLVHSWVCSGPRAKGEIGRALLI